MRNKYLALIAALLLLPQLSLAVTIEKPLPDRAQEARAQALFAELKCVVCEGQALAESDAPLAIDMRQTIRTMLTQGASDAAILAYFSTRYGDGILLTPPMDETTMILWLAPLLTLLIGLGCIWHYMHPRPK